MASMRTKNTFLEVDDDSCSEEETLQVGYEAWGVTSRFVLVCIVLGNGSSFQGDLRLENGLFTQNLQ